MAVASEKRTTRRVTFSRGVPVRVAAIEGTWTRHCLMMDASRGGAKLTFAQSVEGLQLKEFFLLLSTTGSSFRRCELAWINGGDMGVRFVEKSESPKAKERSETA